MFSGSSVHCFSARCYIPYQCKGSKPAEILLIYLRHSRTSSPKKKKQKKKSWGSEVCSFAALHAIRVQDRRTFSLTIWESTLPFSSCVVIRYSGFLLKTSCLLSQWFLISFCVAVHLLWLVFFLTDKCQDASFLAMKQKINL